MFTFLLLCIGSSVYKDSAVVSLSSSGTPGPRPAVGESEAPGHADPGGPGRGESSPTPPSTLRSYTDSDGRCPGLLPPGPMKAGTYKLSFDTEGYWKKRGQESFYPYVEVRAQGGGP